MHVRDSDAVSEDSEGMLDAHALDNVFLFLFFFSSSVMILLAVDGHCVAMPVYASSNEHLLVL